MKSTNLMPGDILAVKTKRAFSRKCFDWVLNNYKKFNHTLVYAKKGKMIHATRNQGSLIIDVPKSLYREPERWAIIRYDMTPEQRKSLLYYLNSNLGTPFGKKRYFHAWLEHFFGVENKHLEESYCTTFIADAYQKAGIDAFSGKATRSGFTSDLLKEAEEHPDMELLFYNQKRKAFMPVPAEHPPYLQIAHQEPVKVF